MKGSTSEGGSVLDMGVVSPTQRMPMSRLAKAIINNKLELEWMNRTSCLTQRSPPARARAYPALRNPPTLASA